MTYSGRDTPFVRNSNTTKRWRWVSLAAAIMFLLALAPQIAPRFRQTHRWSASYFSFNRDEAAYLAYVNALKDGRPRKSDPFSGHDDRAGSPQPESIFSIQFVPAYVLALTARALGISSQAVFVILNSVVALSAALAIFALIRSVIGDSRVACVGTFSVLCCGSLRYAPFITRFSLNGGAQYLPFLRSYLPSFAFPVFVLFLMLVWRITAPTDSRKQFLMSFATGAIFLLLLFSYFYFWTAAIACLCILGVLLLAFRPDAYASKVRALAIVGGVAVVGLFGYWRLLAQRATSTDAFQVVTRTHRPELLRTPELIGILIVTTILVFAWRGALRLRDARILFTLSLALLPLALFNQQVMTGYSIQPIHYELYVANYVALLAAVLAAATIAQAHSPMPLIKRAFAVAAMVAIGWGIIEVTYAIRARTELNRIRDEARPAALRLAEIAHGRGDDPRDAIVFATNIIQADTLPADAPQPVLWAPHMRSFAGVDFAEDKSRYYAQLYYSGMDALAFESLLRETTITPSVVFGWERVNSRLASEPNPISEEEIQQEIRRYADYVATFDHARAATVPLAFAVASRKDNLANLDRWYMRDEGESVGNLMLYRVRLR